MDFRAGRAPLGEKMRIEEGERGIPGQRDALAGRVQRDGRVGPAMSGIRRGKSERDRHFHDPRDIQRPLHNVREAVDMGVEVGVLAGLHEAEMALRHGHRRVTRDRADHRQSKPFDRVAGQFAVPVACRPC